MVCGQLRAIHVWLCGLPSRITVLQQSVSCHEACAVDVFEQYETVLGQFVEQRNQVFLCNGWLLERDAIDVEAEEPCNRKRQGSFTRSRRAVKQLLVVSKVNVIPK